PILSSRKNEEPLSPRLSTKWRDAVIQSEIINKNINRTIDELLADEPVVEAFNAPPKAPFLKSEPVVETFNAPPKTPFLRDEPVVEAFNAPPKTPFLQSEPIIGYESSRNDPPGFSNQISEYHNLLNHFKNGCEYRNMLWNHFV